MSGLLKKHKELLNEYNFEKNSSINLEKLTLGSHKRIWWRCSQGHEWQADVRSRDKGQGCPFCSNHRVLLGYNDLASVNPSLATEWNYERNGDLTPSQVVFSSDKKVWWRCSQGHEWESTIYNRNKGHGCPFCSNVKVLAGYNDLATTDPHLSEEWNYKKNGDIKPSEVLRGSHKKAWWKCSKGHEWVAEIKSRASGQNCPYCANKKVLVGYNDLYTYCLGNNRQDLLAEFDSTKNSFTMKDITSFSKLDVWWKCPEGHSYRASPYRRIKVGSGCGICGHRTLAKGENDLLTTHPDIAKEWDYVKNIETPDEVMTGSNRKKYWFICPKGHSYQSTLLNRKKGTNCPICSMEKHTSLPEKAVYYYVRKCLGAVEENYHNPIIGSKEIDVYLPTLKVGIEYDGRAWHKDYRRDLEKDDECTKNGIVLLRIREFGCPDYQSNSIKRYVKPYNIQELNEAIEYIFKYLNENYNLNISTSVDIDRDRAKILEQLVLSEKENSIANYCPEIEIFWDYEKNGKVSPHQIPHASFKTIFLKCELGHSWHSSANYFSKNPWCPFCSGRKVWSGYNDLFTTNPELIPLWSENNTMDPRKIKKGCNAKALWNCPTCGAEYDMTVIAKARGQGCPYCSGHRVLKGYNDVATTAPELLKDWDYDKNIPLKPDEITSGSNKKIWWHCHVCNYEWRTTVSNRTRLGRGCPKCGSSRRAESVSKPVMQFSLDGNLIAEYKSAMEATRKTGIKQIHRVCRNERKTAGGFLWKYKDSDDYSCK